MKRDMELIRLLLLEVEGEEKPDLSKYTEEQQVYHSALLVEAGLIHGSVTEGENGNPINVQIFRLTWEGHEFLDMARNSSVWKKAVEQIKAAGVTIALPILQEILTSLLKKQLKME